MSRRSDIGNGDTCPLFPEHGNMIVLVGTDPPQQWCSSQMHDGRPGTQLPGPSRAKWPLYGLEDTVATYLARLDKAVRLASLPDLSDVEV